MTKWQQHLQLRAENGDQAADDILWETKDMDENQLAQYLAQNDERVRAALQIKNLADKDANPDLTKEYYEMLNKGIMAGQGEGRFDLYGNKLKTVDDYMQLMGIRPPEGGYTDNERAAFTNPENPSYFGKISPDKLQLAAISRGYDNPEYLLEDMRRVGDMWQRGNRVEGYGPNNEIQPLPWLISALEGFTLPRVKEAQKEGREVTWQDISGDMVELGLNFIPGVGVVSKTGKVIARLPKVPGAIAKTAAYGADVFAVPFGSQSFDVLVNQERDVPRSEYDLKRMTAQAALMGTGKATAKQAIRTGKDVMEGSLGERAGGAEYKMNKGFIENIGEKTDDLIARRQTMLDRKADLARQRQNVKLEGDVDIPKGNTSPDDLIDADNYRILTEEANRISKSRAARDEYKAVMAQEEAVNELDTRFDNAVNEVKKWRAELESQKALGNEAGVQFAGQKLSAAQAELSAVNADIAGPKGKLAVEYGLFGNPGMVEVYKKANEAGTQQIVQLPDGRFVYARRVENSAGQPIDLNNFDGKIGPGQYTLQFPDAEYRLPVPEGTKPAVFRYGKEDITPNTVDRNQAASKAIQADPVLERKMAGNGQYGMEVTRDVVASALFTGASHNDLLGQLGGLESKRADAWWNAQMRKLGELTKSNFSPKQRQENFEAIMDVMSYGLDNIPEDKFAKRPEVYHAIATKLGYPGWTHWSENKVPNFPTTSYSSAD